MSRGRRERGPDVAANDDGWRPGTLSPGKRALTSFADDKAPPSEPGKRTLTQHMTVQRKSIGPATPSATEIAQQGVAGAGDALPFQDRIQASFGRHDVSHVRTATGGDAAESSVGLGASAFTLGDRVGFAKSPDLHTAAHEAAHVVQQRSGVQLRGGIDDGAGDPHEQHADAVADKVVRGESAEPLLDQYMGGRSFGHEGIAAIIQRKTEIPSGMVNARRYLEFNRARANEAIIKHLLDRRLPDPHPRMTWRNEEAFYQALNKTLALDFSKPYDVAMALEPGNPYVLIDELRPLTKAVEDKDSKDDMRGGPVGPWTWFPPIGLALAQLYEQALIKSLHRLGPRWVAIADERKKAEDIEASEIALFAPMDRYVVGPLCRPGVFHWTADSKTLGKKAPERKKVDLFWVGHENKELWNWVRATPPDASVEDVAAAVFEYMTAFDKDNTSRADYYASYLTAAPPLYGIPPKWAITFEETRDFRPAKAHADSDPDHQIAVLGGSSAADQQALVEIGAGGAADAKSKTVQPTGQHDNLVADATAQATHLKSTLAAWSLGGSADKTLAFLTRRARDTSDAAQWVPVLKAQRDNLKGISSGILQLNAAVDQMKLSKTGEQVAPLREIMRFYADAVATSHLNRSCNRMLLRAADAQTSLTARGLAASLRDMDMSVEMMRSGVDIKDWDRNAVNSRAFHLREKATAMQTNMMRGHKVSAEDVEDLQLSAEETSLEAKFVAVDFSLHELEKSAAEAGDGIAAWIAARFSGKFRGLKDAAQAIRDEIADIQREWQRAKGNADAPNDDGVSDERGNLRKAVETAKAAFVKMSKEKRDIREFLQEGANLVKWQQFRTACVRIAALIGVSLVGGFVGGMVARGVAGMMMGTSGAVAMENLALGGTIIARGAGMVAETAITSVGQSLIFDEKLTTSFLENMIMSIGSAGVLKALGSKVEEAARLEKATSTIWQKAGAARKVVLKESAAITGHTIMGIAMGYVAHRIVTGQSQPPPATLEEWMLQGASIAVGRYVGKSIEAAHARQARLKLKSLEHGTKLMAETEKLAELAKRVEQHPQSKDAMDLLEKRHQVLTEEMKVLEELENSPEALKGSKMSKGDLTKAKAEVRHQLADAHSQGFGDVPLHLAGMEELIPGALWSGTKTQIDHAIHTAKESGIDIRVKVDPQGGKWHVEIEGRNVTIEERFDPTARARDPKGGVVAIGAHEPVGKVHGATQPTSDPVAVLAKANEVLAAFATRFKLKTSTNSIEIVVRGKPRKVVIDTKAPDKGVNSPTATYETLPGGDIKITLSDRVAPHHVERALAHELAEIRFVLEGGQPTGANALEAGSKTTTLSAHDIGRLAEIDVMARQLEEARTRGDDATVKRLQDEGLELVKHLGLTGEGGTRRQQLMENEARRVGDPLVGKALEQLKRIVQKPPPAAKPPPGVKNVVYRLTDPFERTKAADSIAGGHAYDKHVVAQGQFKVDDGHGGKRAMTKDEFSAEIQRVIETGQNKQMSGPPARRIYLLGNTLVIHHPGGPDNGTTWRTPDAVKEYSRS